VPRAAFSVFRGATPFSCSSHRELVMAASLAPMPSDAIGFGPLDAVPLIATRLAANATTCAYFSDDPNAIHFSR
jgi:hypothetical protein